MARPKAPKAIRDSSRVVEVHGIPEVKRAFRQMDVRIGPALKAEYTELATTVADAVRVKVPSRKGGARASVKPRATTKGGAIQVGGAKAEYYPWLDFGGSVGRGHRPNRYWSGVIKRDWMGKPIGDGRYLYPTIREHNEEIREVADNVVAKAARRAGFETKETLT